MSPLPLSCRSPPANANAFQKRPPCCPHGGSSRRFSLSVGSGMVFLVFLAATVAIHRPLAQANVFYGDTDEQFDVILRATKSSSSSPSSTQTQNPTFASSPTDSSRFMKHAQLIRIVLESTGIAYDCAVPLPAAVLRRSTGPTRSSADASGVHPSAGQRNDPKNRSQNKDKGKDKDRNPASPSPQLNVKLSESVIPRYCITLNNGGWFLYEVCPYVHIRQFHVDQHSGRLASEFILGSYKATVINTTLGTLSQVYEGGTTCDLTGKPRSTRLEFLCPTATATATATVTATATAPLAKQHQQQQAVADSDLKLHGLFMVPDTVRNLSPADIPKFSIEEMRTCEYVVKMYSPLFCASSSASGGMAATTTRTASGHHSLRGVGEGMAGQVKDDTFTSASTTATTAAAVEHIECEMVPGQAINIHVDGLETLTITTATATAAETLEQQIAEQVEVLLETGKFAMEDLLVLMEEQLSSSSSSSSSGGSSNNGNSGEPLESSAKEKKEQQQQQQHQGR